MERVTYMIVNFCRILGFDNEKLIHIWRGATFHDIGKVEISDAILNKKEPLTDAEYEIIKQYPILSKAIVKTINLLKDATPIPCSHLERWDGSGYPEGLSKDNIPLEARAFGIVDVYDALTSDRPYRKAWTHDDALLYIKEQSGKLFDPVLVEIFIKRIDDIVENTMT